ncbi:MAG: DNA-directed RNA polymerase subunit alpha [Bacteriovoracaceae bacterium]|nr:DNA-directed RNA polymerase subunit alpha [Bacteriovoracaceae bacterium]
MNNFVRKNWDSMIRPQAMETERNSLRENYGKFVAKPLERGYGLTLGNSLRRVLLSSLQGAGIAAIRIEGVDHEFGTINNVKEEVSEIILNLKEVKYKLSDKENITLILDKKGEGPVRAKDVALQAGVEVLNPEHIIANISSGGSLHIEILVARGKGYVTALDNKEMFDLPLGWIYMDTLYSPVQRVNYTVTNSRVGKRTDYDKLTLEVWTNAGVTPEDAVSFSAKILREQLSIFLNFKDEESAIDNSKPVSNTPINDFLLKPVSELELSVRSANCLQNANIKYIYELVSKTEGEMLRTKNFGRKSLNEIKEILTNMGLGLGMKVDSIIKKGQDVKETSSMEDEIDDEDDFHPEH